MKIAILMPNCEDYHGTNIAAALHSTIFADMGHAVTVFLPHASSPGSPTVSFSPKVEVRVVKYLLSLSPWTWQFGLIFFALPPFLHRFAIRHYLKALSSFDLVVAYDYPLSWVGHYAKKQHGLRYIMFAQMSFLHEDKKRALRGLYRRIRHRGVRLTFGTADLVTTETKIMSAIFKEHLNMESVVVRSVTDLCLFNPQPKGQEIRSRLHLGDALLILYVDVLREDKGVHILLQAFGLVRESIPDAKLILVGKCLSKSYWAQIRHLVDNSVVVLDYVQHGEIGGLYAQADVFATCAVREDTFSHTVAEAQASGTPVVAFNVGAHEEIINDGETGILVDQVGNSQAFASALLKLLNDRALAANMGTRAAEWGAQLSAIAVKEVQGMIDKVTECS